MVELSESGQKWFAEYLENKESNSAIRVFLSEIG